MNSRRNFLDADNSIMEKNLRFVKDDFAENLNQYFGGADRRGSNSTNVSAPPRDYKVVQPKPGGSKTNAQSHGLEKRKGLLLQLGFPRHEAYEIAKSTDFDLNYIEQKYHEFVARGFPQDEVNKRILCIIRDQNSQHETILLEREDIPRETSPEPLISTSYEEQDSLNVHRREVEDRGKRSLSRSSARIHGLSRDDRNRKEHYQRERSISPKKSANPFASRKNEEYFSQNLNLNIRDNERGETNRERSYSRSYSPRTRDRRGNPNRLSISRSPNRVPNIMQERRDEEYSLQREYLRDEKGRNTIRRRSRSYSPARIHHRENYCRSSRSRSPNRRFNERNFDQHRYDINEDRARRDVTREQYIQCVPSPPRNFRRAEGFSRSRSRTPKMRFSSKGREIVFQHDDFIMRDRSRSNSLSKFDNRRKHHLSRSRSPSLRFAEREFEGKHVNFRNKNNAQPHSRASFSSVNDRRNEVYKPARSRSPKRNLSNDRRNKEFSFKNYHNNSREASPNVERVSSQNIKFDDSRMISKKQKHFSPNRNIPSLLENNVRSSEAQNFEEGPQNRNIPSLLSLNFFSKRNQFQQSSTKKSNLYHQKATQAQNLFRTEIPIILSGLIKPSSGHLKANPMDYWSKWWPQFKYIEKSIPIFDPNDSEVQNCIHFLSKPNSLEFHKRCHLLLTEGIREVMKTVNIDETNYCARPIFKLFKFKAHLESPEFQNSLNPAQLNCIAPALRQFQIKPTMAFLHQALIAKWHICLDEVKQVKAGLPIMSNSGRTFLNQKSFHFLVMESIQKLKKMCQQDWPEFNEFYKNIKAKRVDIYAIGVDKLDN